MEFIDLRRQQLIIKDNLISRMNKVLEHGRYIMGPEIAELENHLAAFTGAKHCVTCASGSQALEMVLAAWNVGSGDAIFTTPLSFIATAEAIVRCGATPIFVDIDLSTYDLDASLLEKAVSAVQQVSSSVYPLPAICRNENMALRPRAIIPVDLFGNPCDYERLLAIAGAHDLLTLEDAAQGFGAKYHGANLCNCGCTAAATSFFPAKPLGCYGDGGAMFTNDPDLAARLDSLRYHGRVDSAHKNENIRIGYNGRLDTLQAAILLAKLEVFPAELRARQEAARRYSGLLEELAPDVKLPEVTPGSTSSWAQYTIRLPDHANRAAIMKRMAEKGIPTFINYPISMHMQKSLEFLGYKPDDFPNAKKAAETVLSLPMHPYFEPGEQEKVVEALAKALAAEAR